VCCATKRLVEIHCPADCVYLTTAREHPPAAAVRRQQRDLSQVVEALRDFNERQSRLFLAVNTTILRYQPADLHAIVDEDVIEAAAALAATFETASRGLIYEHRPATRTAEHLGTALRQMLSEAGQRGGSAFERDAAVVLRRIEQTARGAHADDPGNPRAYLGLLDRVVRQPAADRDSGDPAGGEGQGSRLILP
jgi:hypothetical protein